MTLTQHDLGHAWCVALAGEADLAAVPAVQAALRQCRTAEKRALIVDLRDVTFVNTPIWGLLIEHYQWAQQHGAKIAVAGMQGRALASFEIVQLGAFLPHFPTRDAAAEALRIGD
jgi:anti-sigma B factor antagonist